MARASGFGLVWLIVLATHLAVAGEQLEHWVAVRSTHFTVVTDGAVDDAERLAQRFERLRLVFSRLWPTARTDTKPVIVIAPSAPAGLAPLLPPEWARDDAIHPAGLMVSGLDRTYLGVPLQAPGLGVDAVATHEYVHLLVEANVPCAPLWLNEGLAEFFAAGRLDQRPAVFGLPHTGHLQVLRSRDWLPLPVVLAATRGAASVRDQATSAVFYAQAWALVHYLKLGDGGRHAAALTAFTALVTQGVPAGRAAVEAFGDLASLERRLREYVRGDRFFDARLPVPADEQTAASRRFERTPPWEATLLLGDFLTHVVHYADAERHLARAELLAPGSSAVCERRALLAFQRQDLPARSPRPSIRWRSIPPGRWLTT